MGERDAMYKLNDIVELDETYYGGAVEGDKRGRGTSKMKVLVALSLSSKLMGFVKMKIVDRIDIDIVKEFIQNGIEKGSKIITDGLNVYLDLKSIGYIHERRIVGDQKTHEVLPSIHTILSNAKYFDHYQVRHIEKIERYWNLCLIAWTLTYWIKQNAYLNKILETQPTTFNEFKQAINSLLELSSLGTLSKNKTLADDYFKVKSKRLKKKLAA